MCGGGDGADDVIRNGLEIRLWMSGIRTFVFSTDVIYGESKPKAGARLFGPWELGCNSFLRTGRCTWGEQGRDEGGVGMAARGAWLLLLLYGIAFFNERSRLLNRSRCRLVCAYIGKQQAAAWGSFPVRMATYSATSLADLSISHRFVDQFCCSYSSQFNAAIRKKERWWRIDSVYSNICIPVLSFSDFLIISRVSF